MAGIQYPPYRGKPFGQLRRRWLPRLWTTATRLTAVALYVLAALVAFAILAPVLPAAPQTYAYAIRDVVPGLNRPAEPAPTYDTRLPAKRVKVEHKTSVALIALNAGSTPFELYALNGKKVDRLVVKRGVHVRVPAG